MKLLATLSLLLLLTAPTRAQIGMGSGTPHPSAALDVQATDKAFYPPRLTTIQRKDIVNPQPGAFVFDLDKGTFYLFDGVNWLPLSFIPVDNSPSIDRTASDGVAGDYFGSSVAISGDYAVVGSPLARVNGNAQQGAAYVFVRTGNTWRQDVKLTNFAGAASDQFGASVAISGNIVIVGSPYDDVGGNVNQGSAHAYVRSGGGVWSHTQLFASDGAAEDRFGHDVAISGNYALVGSFLDDHTFVDQGSAYIFALTGTGWVQQSKLIASDGAADDRFGIGVAISGNYALVGSDSDDTVFDKQGSAYIFLRSGSSWIQQSKLTAADPFPNDQFGFDVALWGDYALVGSLGGEAGQAQVLVQPTYLFDPVVAGLSRPNSLLPTQSTAIILVAPSRYQANTPWWVTILIRSETMSCKDQPICTNEKERAGH